MPDLNKIIEDLSSLTVAEAAELSKQLEEKWGVTPMAAAGSSSSRRCRLQQKIKMILQLCL
jgi:large subunit ribosomal protein L7/L12